MDEIELQKQLLEMQEQLKQLVEDKEIKDKLLQDKEKETEELKLLNQKLFLRVTTPSETIDDKEDEEKELKEYVGEKVFNILDKKDKQLLKEIIEGED